MKLGVCHLQRVPRRVPDVNHMPIFYENLWQPVQELIWSHPLNWTQMEGERENKGLV